MLHLQVSIVRIVYNKPGGYPIDNTIWSNRISMSIIPGTQTGRDHQRHAIRNVHVNKLKMKREPESDTEWTEKQLAKKKLKYSVCISEISMSSQWNRICNIFLRHTIQPQFRNWMKMKKMRQLCKYTHSTRDVSIYFFFIIFELLLFVCFPCSRA